MDHRRRRSIALQQAKERVKLERQEAAAALRSAKRLRSSAAADGGAPNHRNDGSWCGDGRRRQSTAASRAERYKRRSALFEMDDSTRQESPSEQPRALQPSQRQPRYEAGGSAVAPRHPETKEELMERAGRLLLELLSRQTVAWPVLRATGWIYYNFFCTRVEIFFFIIFRLQWANIRGSLSKVVDPLPERKWKMYSST